jgi:hypothetical protein
MYTKRSSENVNVSVQLEDILGIQDIIKMDLKQ